MRVQGERYGRPHRVGEHLRGRGHDGRGTVEGVAAHQRDPGVLWVLGVAAGQLAEDDSEQFAVSGGVPGAAEVDADASAAPAADDGVGRPVVLLQGERGQAVQDPRRRGGRTAGHGVRPGGALDGQFAPAGLGEGGREVVAEPAAGEWVVAHGAVFGVAELVLVDEGRGARCGLVLGRFGAEGQDAVPQDGGILAGGAGRVGPRGQESEHRRGHGLGGTPVGARVRHLGPLRDQIDPARTVLVQRDGAGEMLRRGLLGARGRRRRREQGQDGGAQRLLDRVDERQFVPGGEHPVPAGRGEVQRVLGLLPLGLSLRLGLLRRLRRESLSRLRGVQAPGRHPHEAGVEVDGGAHPDGGHRAFGQRHGQHARRLVEVGRRGPLGQPDPEGLRAVPDFPVPRDGEGLPVGRPRQAEQDGSPGQRVGQAPHLDLFARVQGGHRRMVGVRRR